MKTILPEFLAVAAIDRMDRVERNREACWSMVSLQDRQRAIGVAGLAKERAADPLAAFSDDERRTVCMALAAHCAQMQWISDCMSGTPRVLH